MATHGSGVAAEQRPLAERRPVARVCVDVLPHHLDRLFEYLVPAEMDDAAQPGVRVKVRFAGREVAGWLLERVDTPEHGGRLSPLRRVVSPEQVLAPQVADLARAVADRYAGTLADVLRLAVPARHARVEAEPDEIRASLPPPQPGAQEWADYRGGPAFVRHLRDGGAPRAVWSALPSKSTGAGADATGDWTTTVAQSVAACVLGGRGALVVVPDARDVARVVAALTEVGLPLHQPGTSGGTVRLEASVGPARRYRAFLAALRGRADVVVGTRAAAFAPVRDLGLAVCWDDGDDLHAEPRAPYPHVREVLALRAEREGCALLLGAFGRSVPAQGLVERGWAQAVAADRPVLRDRTPRVRALTSVELAREGPAAAARLPGPAWRAVRERLADGPVLVQVPRAGYLPVVACARCREAATCHDCHGPVALDGARQTPRCTWCGQLLGGWRCAECGAEGLRAVRIGSERTAEELGRAFPGVPVRVSGAGATGGVLNQVSSRPALVVATPGAEPVADGGFAAAVLLDAQVGAGLRDETETLRRWMAAAGLVRADGEVLVVGDGPPRPTQALVRWDPAWLASLDLAERAELGLPPAVRVVTVTGTRSAVATLVDRVDVPGVSRLGPVPVDDDEVRVLLRAPLRQGPALTAALSASLSTRSAKREPGTVRVRVDPADLR